MLQIMGPFLEKKVRVHVADSRLELAEKLAACGFDKASLPKCVGGAWGYEMFSQWQENRIRYEVSTKIRFHSRQKAYLISAVCSGTFRQVREQRTSRMFQ